MTLGRLMELYQAEQQGKQIMLRSFYYGVNYHYEGTSEYISEVKLTECELSDLAFHEEDASYTYFIKDEEDKYGNKLNHEK